MFSQTWYLIKCVLYCSYYLKCKNAICGAGWLRMSLNHSSDLFEGLQRLFGVNRPFIWNLPYFPGKLFHLFVCYFKKKTLNVLEAYNSSVTFVLISNEYPIIFVSWKTLQTNIRIYLYEIFGHKQIISTVEICISIEINTKQDS